MTLPAEHSDSRAEDPLRRLAPVGDDVEARRAKAAIEGRLFSGPPMRVQVGRYTVKGRLGSGGMGVVYRAHDPGLARDVAVKLLNSESKTHDQTTAHARLVREARAMARVSHPNVIHVYDVGTVKDGVFIAMELVDGQSLDKWLKTGPSWEETLRRFIDAGRGLAAAHEAGLVHRDFKPENVLLGTDGRVRVADFGLAGASASLPELTEVAGEIVSTSNRMGELTTLTQTGARLGTPKYMAPEQETTGVAMESSDQFSFCVALYEALFDQSPFEGTSIGEYRRHVHAGDLIPPPVSTPVPSSVRDAIRIGLASNPNARHPDMRTLLVQLEAAVDPQERARRYRIPVAAGLVALIGLASITGWLLGRRPRSPLQALTMAPLLLVDTTGSVPVTHLPRMPLSPPPASPDESSAMETVASVVPQPRPRTVCYWSEDYFEFISHRSYASRHIKLGADRCFECRPARKDLSDHVGAPKPISCTQHRICVSRSCRDSANAH